MPKIDDIERELESLSRAEKARLLQRIVQDLGDSFPGIESVRRQLLFPMSDN